MGVPDPGRERLTATERQRLRDEVEQLSEQRRLLAESLAGGQEPGDSADQADTIERSAELHRVDDRIGQLRALLTDGGTSVAGYLPIGTRAVLRYPDGDDEAVEVGYAAQESAGGATITADSPLARALAGRVPGEPITWSTPGGDRTARLVSLQHP